MSMVDFVRKTFEAAIQNGMAMPVIGLRECELDTLMDELGKNMGGLAPYVHDGAIYLFGCRIVERNQL